MTTLALEFSSPQRSVAVWRSSENMTFEAVETGEKVANAFGLIEKVLADAKLEREQVELIAVGVGPGSYTGIRVALSIAQGWQLVTGMKLLGVNSAAAIAAQARAEKIFGRVNVVIDAQRNEFYLAAYEISAGGCREIEPLRIIAPAEISPRPGEVFVGPEVTRWFPAGKIFYPHAAALAGLAAGRTDFVPGENLTPIYLRPVEFVKTTSSWMQSSLGKV